MMFATACNDVRYSMYRSDSRKLSDKVEFVQIGRIVALCVIQMGCSCVVFIDVVGCSLQCV